MIIYINCSEPVKSKLIPTFGVKFTLHIVVSFDLTDAAQLTYIVICLIIRKHPVVTKEPYIKFLMNFIL